VDVLPDVPAIGESVPGYEATGWNGIGAPANTSQEIITLLNKQVNAALADPTFKARLVGLGIADMAAYPWIVPHKRQGQNLDDFPNVKRWFATIRARPATTRAYEKGKPWMDRPAVTEAGNASICI
jgi:glutathione S-transferase